MLKLGDFVHKRRNLSRSNPAKIRSQLDRSRMCKIVWNPALPEPGPEIGAFLVNISIYGQLYCKSAICYCGFMRF